MKADTLLVMPTIREYQALGDYLANADRHRFPRGRLHVLLVTEDFCDRAAMKRFLADQSVEGDVVGAKERAEWLKRAGVGKHEAVIPRRSHAETSFGLLYQWHLGFPYGVFIDDDTRAGNEDFFGTHRKNLTETSTVPAVSADNGWVNVLHERFSRHRLHPRGFPYAKMSASLGTQRRKTRRVVASQGLWTNVCDLDAVRILMGGDLQGQGRPFTQEEDFPSTFVVETGNQTTISSMNLAFRREVIPAFYQFPMDDNEWRVGRFDDIWSGFCLKHIADAKGLDILHGRPLCRHDKAPRSTFKDLVAEANGLELNERFCEHLPPVEKKWDWGEAYLHLAKAFGGGDFRSYVNGAFLNHCGRMMQAWSEAVDALEP